MAQKVAVHGLTEQHTTGPHGDADACEETLHVTVDGEDVYVPVTGVRKAAYDYRGDVPTRFDVSRVYLYDGVPHADAVVDGGRTIVEVMPRRNRPHGAFELEAFDADTTPGVSGDQIIWERPTAARDELATLVDEGLSPAQALDYWMCEIHDVTRQEWADRRGTTHQAVTDAVQKARRRLALPAGRDDVDTTLQVGVGPDPLADLEAGDARRVAHGTHVYGEYAVERVYDVRATADGYELVESCRQFVDDDEVNRHETTWSLVDDDDVLRAGPSGDPLADFIESNHNADPELDIELAADEAGGAR
jgi:hypothetical protein